MQTPSPPVTRVIVVGAGISGLSCARELAAAGITVSIRERAMSVGGRMASPRMGGRVVDMGASYFTASDPAFTAQVQDWCERGLARRWTDRFPVLSSAGLSEPKVGPWRYAAPGGLRSLVADLSTTPTRLRPVLRSPISSVGPGPAVDGERADAVVLAMPDPQAKRLLGSDLADVRANVAGRRWEPVLALMARFPQRSWPDFHGAFVADDATLSWVADDGLRRGDAAAVLVAHSTPGFAAGWLEAPQRAGSALAAALDRLLECGTPTAMRVHRWTFARPADAREQPYFFGADRVGLAGDSWGTPRVETAWLSGRALGQRIAADLGG